MHTLSVPFEIKSVSDAGRIEGYGAVFNNVDFGMDRIEPGAFSDFLKTNKTLPMLLNHADTTLVGLWDDMLQRNTGVNTVEDQACQP